MQVTKNLAELCALLIDELYGELPSRIFATLLNRGRSSLVQLVQYTSLTSRQLRHGLAVLTQQNLLFFYVDNDTKLTTYEANPDPAYNILRTGKILEMVESMYNAAVKDVMQSLLIIGQTRISDLKAAYEEKIRQWNPPGNVDEEMVDGEAAPAVKKSPFPVKSIAHLNSIICRLVEAELVDVVHVRTFQSPDDILRDVEKQVTDAKFPNGIKGGKAKVEYDEAVAQELRKVRRESKSLKRKLDESSGSAAKRRKLLNGMGANGAHEGDVDPILDPKQVIRVNYERCLVELRNRRLVQFATEMIGETTGYIYAVLLRQLTRRTPRCHSDPSMDFGDMDDDGPTGPAHVTTMEILDNLSTSVDVSAGIGKASRGDIRVRTAEKIRAHLPDGNSAHPEADVDGGASSDEDAGDSDFVSGDSDYDTERETKPVPRANGTNENKDNKEGKVRFEESAAPRESRVDQMRQHLLLLSESKLQFVRHCGRGQWTVDFQPLIQQLREVELDVVIERTAGRQGLRLVRILRQKGKLDEKTLPTIALVRKPDVQNKMLEMQMAGFVDIQEVPRDSSRTANRTLFLWFSDTDRALDQLLDNTYKTVLRCLQTLAVHRRKEKDVLMLTKRSDVKGREKDVMQKEYYDRFARFLDTERKLLGHMMRLDDLVAVLRDY